MKKFYAKQVGWKEQDSNLFYDYKSKETGRYETAFNDDYYTNETIIYGNKDFADITTKDFNKILKFDDSNYYEFEGFFNQGYKSNFDNLTEALNWYFAKHNAGEYTKKEVHKWKELLFKYFDSYRLSDEFICGALKLITGKKWRGAIIKGSMQREYQYIYVSENISDEMIRYLEICYFNTGAEYIIYESEEDFKNEDNGYSIYVDSWKSEEELCKALGCEMKDIEIYNFNGYTKQGKWEKYEN